METADVIVVGGGMVGAALAYGLARRSVDTMMLDEGDRAFRAARGNFGLVWIQTKGLGLQRYQAWSRESGRLYPDFAEELRHETGVDIGHRRPGGLIICASEDEYRKQAWINAQMAQQAGEAGYHAEMIDRAALERLLDGPRLGPGVAGASFSPEDGHVGPLPLLRALHEGFARAGGRYRPLHTVEGIGGDGRAYAVRAGGETFAAPKVVLACGNGIPALAAELGLNVPTRPERGQILVTERVPPMFRHPMGSIRQTAEGSVMLGVTNEDTGFDDGTTRDAAQAIAARAVRIFPDLARLRLVRTWAALRVIPPDRHPIYDESESHPGVFAVTNHSGVTLAAVHARRLSAWIADGEAPDGLEQFSARRFDAAQAA